MTRSMRLRCCKTFCAASWSDQKSGSDALSSKRRSSSFFDATSKKPPDLLDARAQVFGAQAQVPGFTVTQLQSSRHSTSTHKASRNQGLRPNRLPPSQRQRDGEQADERAGGGECVAEHHVKRLAALSP